MPKCVVEAVADGEVVASYTIILNSLNSEVTEEEFIRLAKENFAEDDLPVSLIDEWRVKEVEPDTDA